MAPTVEWFDIIPGVRLEEIHRNEARVASLEAERDRYREALEQIAAWRLPGEPDVFECRAIARQALDREAG